MWWMVLASLLFPGFGQALVHRRLRAAGWAVGAVAAYVLTIWTVWFFVVMLCAHVAAAVDAERVLRRDARPGGLDRMFGAAIVVAGAVGFGLARLYCVRGFRIPTSSMQPTIEIGDYIFVDELTMHYKPVERGEVIILRYPCNPSVTFIKRAVAIGGDTVEVRCDVLYVNGKAVPHAMFEKETEYEDRDESSGVRVSKRTSRWHEQIGDHTFDVFEGPEATGVRDFPRLDAPFGPGCASQTMFRKPTTSHEIRGTLVTTKQGAERCEPQLHYVVPDGAVFVLGDNRYNSNDSRNWGAVREDDVIGRVIGLWAHQSRRDVPGRFGDVP
jgi:signal peptidase I